MNSQVGGSSGLVTGVSVDAGGNGLIDTALQQIYRVLTGPTSPAMVVGVTTSGTVQCSGGGSAQVTANVSNSTMLSAGDTATITSSNCIQDGITLNGTLSLTFNSLTGTPSPTSAWSGSLAMKFTNFSATTPTGTPVINGDLTLNVNQSGFQKMSFSATGNSLKMTVVKNGATSDRTLTNYSYTGSLDAGIYTYNANFTMSGNFPTLGNVSYTVKTTTDFKVRPDSFPSQGVLTVTATDKTSATLTVIDSTNVKIGLDKNGDGTIDESVTTTWTALAARG